MTDMVNGRGDHGVPRRRGGQSDGAILGETMERLGVSRADLATLLGVSGTAVKSWMDGTKGAPYWIEPACKGLVLQLAEKNPPAPPKSDSILVVRVPPGKLPAVEAIMAAMDLKAVAL